MGATVVKQTKAQRDAQRRRERIEEAKKLEQGGNVAPTIGAQTFTPLQMYLCFGEGVNNFIRANAQVPFYSLSEPYYILNWLRGQVPAAELATLPAFPGIIHQATTMGSNNTKTGQKKTPKVQPDKRTMGAGAGGGTTEQPQA